MAFVLYGHLIAFVTCARWTGDIYYPNIKLSDLPLCKNQFNGYTVNEIPPFRYNLYKLSFALRSVAEDM